MTRTEALEALELPATATAAEIERAYERIYTDFQIRLDNAPTDRLRERFRDRMRTLEQAYALLRRDAAGPEHAPDRDLPGSEPTRGTGTTGAAGGHAGAGAAKGSLLIRTDETCTVSVAGGRAITLPAGKALRLRLPPGTHRIEATTVDGRRWSATVGVAAGSETQTRVEFAPAAGAAGQSGAGAARSGRSERPPRERGTSRILGVDWGHARITLAVLDDGAPRIVPGPHGERATPAAVAFLPDGRRLVGAAALRQAAQNPQGTFTRLLALLAADPGAVPEGPWETTRGADGRVRLLLPGTDGPLLPEEIAATLIDTLLRTADGGRGVPQCSVVLGVPAGFGTARVRRLRDACAMAGIQNVRVVAAPYAVALAYGLDRGGYEHVAVCDLGASTFGVSVLELGEGIYEVKTVVSDLGLGGDAFDRRVADWLADRFRSEHGIDLSGDAVARGRLVEAAERTRIALSTASSAVVEVPYLALTPDGPVHLRATLERSDIDGLLTELVQQAARLAEDALTEAGMRRIENSFRAKYRGDLEVPGGDQVRLLLVGGASRTPQVRQALVELVGTEPSHGLSPDEAAAAGLAVQAGVLDGQVSDVLLLDITQAPLGITLGGDTGLALEDTDDAGRPGLVGDGVAWCIPRDTTIPTKRSEVLTTAADGLTEVEVHVVEGTGTDVATLVRLRLDGITPAPAGTPRIEVTLDIDANGVLQVAVRDRAAGSERRVRVESGLAPSELERLKLRAAALRGAKA